MVGRFFAIGVLCAAAAWATGCVVKDKKDDLLYEFYECQTDDDCVDGFACRMALGPDSQPRLYCTMNCSSDDDCRYGLFCGRQGLCTWPELVNQYAACTGDEDCPEGFGCRFMQFGDPDEKYCMKDCRGDTDCMEGQLCRYVNKDGDGYCVDRCVVGASGVCPAGWNCMVEDINPGSDQGYCVPADTCGQHSDCGSEYNLCLARDIEPLMSGLSVVDEGSPCVSGCGGGSSCPNGYHCLRDVVRELFAAEAEGLPAVCLPTCGQGGACPSGFRCLKDLLDEFLPIRDWSELDMCFPGLAFTGLPCRPGMGECYQGECVENPEGGLVHFCAVHCDTGGGCPFDEYSCIDTNDDLIRDENDYCFELGCTTPGSQDECDPGQTCRTFALIGEFRPGCSDDCAGSRTGTCGPQETCIMSDQGTFGCITGHMGLPCDTAADCRDLGIGPVDCLGSSGGSSDLDRICTRPCTRHDECDWYRVESSLPGYCRGPVCWSWSYGCQRADGTGPVLDCVDPDQECVTLDPQDPIGFCTQTCSGARPDPPDECGVGGACLSIYLAGSYCFMGWMGMPCSQDSECLALSSSGPMCRSITGSDPAVDGTCSASCKGDDTCGSLAAFTAFCLPGETENGLCFTNPTFHTGLDLFHGRQGSYCYGEPSYCAPGYLCMAPTGTARTLDNYCVEECSAANPVCETPHHVCVPSQNGSAHVCTADVPYPDGRGFDAPCLDYRQCESAVCSLYHPDISAEEIAGYCTRLCGAGRDPCPIGWTCDGVCIDPNREDATPQPI